MILLLQTLWTTAIDIVPIAVIISVFQFAILRRRLHRAKRILLGFIMVWLGLTLFLVGLEQALFPIGSLMAEQLLSEPFLPEISAGTERHWSHYYWIYLFAFAIGGAATMAEPALIAVSLKAGEMSNGRIKPLYLRIAVSMGMALGITLGAVRIVNGLPLQGFIMVAYVIVIVQTMSAPKYIVPLAYDSGGVTTSTVTVPIITALGLGLAVGIEGRDPLLDGFGMIALACLFPIMTVMGYAQMADWSNRRRKIGRE